MDIRKYLVQLNSNGEYIPYYYDKNSSLSKDFSNNNNSLNKKKRYNKINNKSFINCETQYALDFGQKDFDAAECKVCKMLYTKGEIADERHHFEYHDLYINSVKFNGWKLERTVFYFYNNSKIISVYPDDPKYMLNKVQQLYVLSEEEICSNFSFDELLKEICIILIYITDNRRIAGFVAGEKIKKAFRLISDQPYIISKKSEKAEVGITRLWVHKCFRRKKIATNLIDVLRANLYKDRIITREKIAFSEHTNTGKEFAKNYTNNDLLIYTHSM